MRQLSDAINDVLVDWSIYFIQQQKIAATKIKKSTGRGSQSFEHGVQKATSNDVARAVFIFESYLRFADMRKLHWSQLPPTDDIVEWIKKTGVEKFINSYSKKRSLPKSRTQLINSIAWGIRKKKFLTGKRKRIKWYNKQKEFHIASLYGQLLKSASLVYLDNLKKSLE